MRSKLQKFTAFANTLLPHETVYLLSVQQLEDPQKLEILQRIDYNCRHIDQFTPFDTKIDKRKYSHLKNWIVRRLDAIDVDRQFAWMIDLEQKIVTDRIDQAKEKQLLRAVRNYQHPAFYFSKFYELLRNYRQFLLIRMRHADHQLVNDFLQEYHEAYLASKRTEEQMHQATQDIVKQYAENSVESIQWEKWLDRIFFDEKLDGYHCYMAFVRLTFISFNYRKFDLLEEKFDHLDRAFLKGRFYSRRILLNYYSIRMLFSAKLREFEQSIYYGYLSVRGKTHDYLFYVNNLSAVLQRAGRAQEALQLMRNATQEMKTTQNMHNKIGFVAYYVKSLLGNQLFRNAENYAETFLKAYEREVLQYRWHTFFSAYLEALLGQHKYRKLLRVAEKYRLEEREASFISGTNYLPSIHWYTEVARYKEGMINQQAIRNHLEGYLSANRQFRERTPQLRELLSNLRGQIPEVVNYLQFG